MTAPAHPALPSPGTVDMRERTGLEVAVVGMAGRFPGADDLQAFWRNLREEVESISFFTPAALLEAGVDPALVSHPAFVPARGELRGADELDAALFRLSPRDAGILDPQHRVLLELAWAALEHAGCDPAREERPVGVFAGCSTSAYVRHLEARAELVRAVGATRIALGNDRDHLAAGVSYRLDLRGPAVNVQTACSTSLVAVHLACQSLLAGECDLALAGGVSAQVPLRSGYVHTPDGVLSPDGHCRALDADARGTVPGNGAGVVVLRRLDDALAEGDTIHAVILGSAINNDGALKVGYTAPSAAGQARAISEALQAARVDPATVQYLETHGTGTPLGDAIELQAIARVLGGAGEGHRCALGSVKPNVGHLDAAAGIAGLIKTVLALEHAEIPPSLNCAVPHPGIQAAGGRVYVNTALAPWARDDTPRRAGVSSFGIGGTNAHVVLEEAPPREPSGPSRPLQLLVLSARTATALARAAESLADHLERQAPPLADAAYTLQTGRRQLEHRLAVVCADTAGGAARLRQAAAREGRPVPRTGRPVAFLFPGLGMHHVGMARGLYEAEPAFRAAVDECCELLRPLIDCDLRHVLYPSASPASAATGAEGWDLRAMLGRDKETAPSPLDDTRVAQPAVFVVEYALARLWMSWGVRPRALLGHSLGEYVAACVAGVLRLEDALRLVALRARLIDAHPAGAMLAVPLGEAALREMLPPALDLAAVNTPESCVVAGGVVEVEAFEAALAGRGIVSRRLAAGHAFHSRAMEPVAAGLERLVAGFDLRAPEIPFVSNVTGTWVTDDEARSPVYWARHLCGTVRFADGVATLRQTPGWALLEVGPGQTLGAWALQHPAGGVPEDRAVFSSLRHPHNRVDDLGFLLEGLGGLWAAGVEVDWAAFSRGERRHRIPLPGYPFERRRYWVDPPRAEATGDPRAGAEDGGTKDGGTEDGGTGERGRTDEKGVHVDVMENGAAAPANGAAPSPRRRTVLAQLRRIASELTGIEAAEVDAGVDLFQAGLDSLLLLQAIQAIEKRMGVRLSLIEVLEEMGTLDAVARHIDAALPPGAVIADLDGPASPGPAPASEPGTPAFARPPQLVPAPPALYPPPGSAVAADGGLLEQVIAQQLQAIRDVVAQQLAAVTGRAAPAAAAAEPGVPAASASIESPPTLHGRAETPVSISPHLPRSPRARIQPPTFVAYQPLSTEAPGGMTAEQKEYLDGFIARYVERTKGSKAHQARYHVPLADTRVTARFRRAWKEILYPVVGRRALGSRVWDVDGNEYVDTGMAFGCSLFGHAPEFVTRAIQEQVARGYGLGPQSEDAGRAADLVCRLGGNERAVFCNSGTEAVMGAVRAARALTGRSRVAMFAGSYHGWSDLVLGRLLTAGGRCEVRPVAPGVPAAPLGDVLMLDYDDPASLELLARHLDELALVMVEPVQSRRPDVQPFAFLRELRRMTRDAGVLLHFDELITGFRMAPGGAQQFFGIDADLVTYGKVVAGGLPMGVVAGKREPMSVFDGGVWRYGDDSYPTAQRTLFAGAFWKHPLSMAVTVAVMEEIERGGQPMYDRLNERTTRLVERMNAFFEAEGYPVAAAHFASCFRFFFGPEVQFADLFSHHLTLQGVYVIPETGTHFLSTAHTDEDLDRVFQAVRASAEAMRSGGFLPGGPGAEPVGRAIPAAASSDGASSSGARSIGVVWNGASGEPLRLPLTAAQRQLWIESQMGDDASRAYVESVSVRLRGALDAQALRRALQALVDRHDALRITLTPDGEAQLVHPAREVALPREDFRGVPAEARGAEVDAWVRGSVRRPFDLAAGPLVRFALAAVDDDEHLLLWDAHHAAVDGWSFGVLWKELAALYRAEVEGCAAALPPRPDYAARVREHAAALEDDAAAQAFWRARFADGVPVLELPADRPRPPVRSYRGERITRVMSPRLARRLAEAARPHGLTVSQALLSALALWLSRLSGQGDLGVGTPAAGQAAGGAAAELVGYAVNVLPIRVRVHPADTFAQHARRVRRSTVEAVQHQAFSLPRLVESLLSTRDPGRPPLFSVLMNLDRAPEEARLAGGVRAEIESNFAGGAKLDLDLNLEERGDDLRLACDFATDLFDRGTVEGWLDALERVVEQVAADPGIRLADLELVGDEERGRVVDEWNRTDAPTPAGCVHDLFAEQAARTPDAPAVREGEGWVTYGELNARANRLAHHLGALGVRPESRVGVCLERGAELVAALLGVLRAGGAYLPLDPDLPPERLRWMLADAGAAVLLTDERLRDAVGAPEGVRVVALDAGAEEIAGRPADEPDVRVDPGMLAYVVYTSGSTGTPKGVAVEHRALVNSVWHAARAYGLGPGDRVLQFHSIGFDPAADEIFSTLLSGAALVPRTEAWVEGPRAFWDVAGRDGVTVVQLPTAVWQQLVPDAPGVIPEALRVVVIGGEAALPERLQAWARAAGPRVRLLNSYGPTETTIGATFWEAPAEAGDPSDPVPIGGPVPNTRCYVVDAAMRPLPAGVPGELYVGGAQVARGYLHRPALTAERFVPDPFGPVPGARLYRTGDRVRWTEARTCEGASARERDAHQGSRETPATFALSHSRAPALLYLGRMDDQVKIRGFRVEPGEVEAALRGHPAVRDAVVAVCGDAAGDRRLVAYVTGRAGWSAGPAGLRPDGTAPGGAGEGRGEGVDAEALRAHLRRVVPEHMVPAAFAFLDALPLSAHGKVDRARLPAPPPASGGRYAAPRTPVEERLAGVWREVLGVERVGRDDGFFELGGHSLLLVRLAARLREALGRDVSVVDLLRFSTIAGLAQHLEGDAGDAAPPPGSERAARRRQLAAARDGGPAHAGGGR